MAELDYNYIGELVELSRGGNSDAFAELYAATYQKQYIFSYCYLKDKFLAQDALQETYILALKNLATLNDPKLFVSWLNQINFRVCYSLAEKQKRWNEETSRYADAAMELRAAPEPSPEQQTISVDNSNYIMQQVMALPYSESQVIFLHYYKHMKLEEIAYMMDISKSTVKRYLISGKKRLAKSLDEYERGNITWLE